jgi:hypothetical protein
MNRLSPQGSRRVPASGSSFFEMVMWNIGLYCLIVNLLILAIEHAIFFYSEKPDLSQRVPLHPLSVILYSFILYCLLKGLAFMLVKARIKVKLPVIDKGTVGKWVKPVPIAEKRSVSSIRPSKLEKRRLIRLAARKQEPTKKNRTHRIQ